MGHFIYLYGMVNITYYVCDIQYVRLILFQGRPRLTELNLSEKVDCNLFDCATVEGHYYKLTKYGKGRALPTGKINYNLDQRDLDQIQ